MTALGDATRVPEAAPFTTTLAAQPERVRRRKQDDIMTRAEYQPFSRET